MVAERLGREEGDGGGGRFLGLSETRSLDCQRPARPQPLLPGTAWWVRMAACQPSLNIKPRVNRAQCKLILVLRPPLSLSP